MNVVKFQKSALVAQFARFACSLCRFETERDQRIADNVSRHLRELAWFLRKFTIVLCFYLQMIRVAYALGLWKLRDPQSFAKQIS